MPLWKKDLHGHRSAFDFFINSFNDVGGMQAGLLLFSDGWAKIF